MTTYAEGAVLPLRISAGDNFALDFVWKSGTSGSETPVALTDYSGTFALQWSPKPGTDAASGSTSVVCTLEDTETGQITASIADTVTDDLTPQMNVTYQLRVTDGAGRVRTLLSGPVTVVASPVEAAEA